MLEENSPLAFAAHMFGEAAMNLTMTAAPDLHEKDLAKVYFDGLVLNRNVSSQTVEGISTPPRLQHDVS